MAEAGGSVDEVTRHYSLGIMNRRQFVSSLAASVAVARAATPDVKRVLVMFKCHLDVGFVDTQAAIIRRYFEDYYPRAIALAAAMRESGTERYVWTTGSWLLYSYLQQASRDESKKMEQAIARGDIAWHALPFTWQSELLDRSMITGCIGFSKSLDKRFGRTTTGAKMTDVPGHSRGLVGPVAASGITFLDIGVNSASTAPEVPDLFVWKDADGARLNVMYHRKDYGGVVRVPGSDLAIAVEVRDDNSGPHTLEEVHKIYADLRSQFPAAEIRAANLTEIANAVRPYQSHFPEVTQEIGDTWIHGIASDPTKMSRYRELLRLRAEWIKSGNMTSGDSADLAFLQKFSLAVEHTWGTDTKTWLDFNHYTPGDLALMLDDPKYRTVTGSWVEKRQDIDDGVAALPQVLRTEALTRLAALTPKQPDMSGLKPLMPGEVWKTKRFLLEFDHKTGAIVRLEDQRTQKSLASAQKQLALFTYQTLSKADYDRFLASYITVHTDWAPKDFGKPNIESFGAMSQLWNPSSAKICCGQERAIVELAFGDQAANSVTAWPDKSFLTIDTSDDGLNLTLSWFQKRSNRMPEALWLTFQPAVSNSHHWSLSKVERPVSPFDVISKGNRHLHALTGPLSHPEISIHSLDASLVSVGVMSPIFFSNDQPDPAKGFHYGLFNNGWGTNYVQWFGEDAQFRFRISY
jgi:hypothetical protein